MNTEQIVTWIVNCFNNHSTEEMDKELYGWNGPYDEYCELILEDEKSIRTYRIQVIETIDLKSKKQIKQEAKERKKRERECRRTEVQVIKKSIAKLQKQLEALQK